ncbi:GntR family transcriptional regulator [Sporosarcina obsidiansis]|uniref:GntR family transcriptional regulator n=1 Tax=Sporosarcina obsidiansis TaxID=2660748 RepID=UPI00129AF367|nr:GntR family transcriptional regulator [Sporosarcina obsidiansis]
MNIVISNSVNQPIYLQIKNQLKEQILLGALKEKEALPSIRKLAKDLQISVITTKKAYEELERDGLIETFPGKGSFVATQNREILKEEQLKKIEEQLVNVIEDGRAFDVDLEELIHMLTLLYEE